MKTPIIEKLKLISPQLAKNIPYLKMLILFGSRATGHVHTESDWDFAAFYDEESRQAHMKNALSWFEVPTILSHLFEIPVQKIDVAELNCCTPLLGYNVARDGKLLYENQPHEFINFQCKAWKVYADTAKFRQAQRETIKLTLQKWGL